MLVKKKKNDDKQEKRKKKTRHEDVRQIVQLLCSHNDLYFTDL